MEAERNVTSETNLEVDNTWKYVSFAGKKEGLFSCSSAEYVWWITNRVRREISISKND